MAEVIGFPQMSDLANNGGTTLGQMAISAKASAAPTYGEQMQTTLNLANLMDQRRQAVATKGILSQPGAMDEQGDLTPQGRTSLAGVNPDAMNTIENAGAMRAYRENMGAGSLLRGQAAVEKQQLVGDAQRKLALNNTLATFFDPSTTDVNNAGVKFQAFKSLAGSYGMPPETLAAMQQIGGFDPNNPNAPIDSQKLSTLQDYLHSTAISHQQEMKNQFSQAGIDQKDFELHDIKKPEELTKERAEIEKERADKANEALKAQQEKDRQTTAQIRERRMLAQLGGKMNDYEKQLSEAVKTELGGRGTIGIATKKVDAAIDTRAALDRYFDPQTGMYNVPSTGSAELATSLSNLLSVTGGGQGGSEAQRKDLQQATLKGDVNKILTYFSGVPQNATTQAALKIVANQIDAVGLQSEQNRTGYFSNFSKKFTALGVDPNKAKIIATAAGNSYADFLKNEYEKLGLPLDDRTLSGIYQNQQGATPGSPAKKKPAGTAAGATVDPNDPLGLFR